MLARTKIDVHLIFNGLGRVAAKYYAATEEECGDLFLTSDYLVAALQAMQKPAITYVKEAELLKHYANLLCTCSYNGLQVEISVSDGVATACVAPHLICDAFLMVLKRLDSKRREKKVGVHFSSEGIKITITDGLQLQEHEALAAMLAPNELNAHKYIELASNGILIVPHNDLALE